MDFGVLRGPASSQTPVYERQTPLFMGDRRLSTVGAIFAESDR